ncbi:uncharacterized protein CELE_R07E5.17 [Caenorhabditis elegans]|uniref:Uncharacterized protein n=1 Tax=Caenorhabditis elegans TaxID=6239 RepID=Q7YWU4_CAEEL|nr:Uncharacterized protein CELE_R07E5.17 [Caenorhabditis elegans]CAE17933.2 Uncharacterized protein CELE_R07E5.17 [Caenorhabditis elegans]|eukprot:NP_001022704.2 Uncharacterized protein CELE_R07E5.17 [Caenorhabditis elegans]
MKFIIICNWLLFLLCYKWLGNWEIPINLGFDPFRVVGGFPTLVDSFFQDFFEKPTDSSKTSTFPLDDLQYPVVTPQLARKMKWNCSIIQSSDKCFTVIKSSECLASTQFSYNFWENSEEMSECFHKSKGNMECRIPFQNGNICENVVVGIQKSGNSSIFIELDDIMINTQIFQNYAETKHRLPNNKISENSTREDFYFENSDFCQNYSIHELVLISGENNTDIYPFFQFGINSTSLPQNAGCSPPFPADMFICNCRNSPSCQVPFLYLTPNSTFCGSTTISIYHTRGFIYSAVVAESPNDIQKHTITFFDLPQTPPRTKFDLKRGRFHCPSETTCIAEILYPFHFLNSLEMPYQIGILVFSMIFGGLIMAKLNNK